MNFIVYCFKCLLACLSCTIGRVPESFTWKDLAVGITTLLVLIAILILVIWLISFIIKKGK